MGKITVAITQFRLKMANFDVPRQNLTSKMRPTGKCLRSFCGSAFKGLGRKNMERYTTRQIFHGMFNSLPDAGSTNGDTKYWCFITGKVWPNWVGEKRMRHCDYTKTFSNVTPKKRHGWGNLKSSEDTLYGHGGIWLHWQWTVRE